MEGWTSSTVTMEDVGLGKTAHVVDEYAYLDRVARFKNVAIREPKVRSDTCCGRPLPPPKTEPMALVPLTKLLGQLDTKYHWYMVLVNQPLLLSFLLSCS